MEETQRKERRAADIQRLRQRSKNLRQQLQFLHLGVVQPLVNSRNDPRTTLQQRNRRSNRSVLVSVAYGHVRRVR